MGILDLFRKKKNQNTEIGSQQNIPLKKLNDDEIVAILEEEIKEFFPKTGIWYSYCFRRPNDIAYGYLPCHLRDNLWMCKLLHKDLNKKGLYIPQQTIKSFMDTSENFAELRHNYELEIVKWQINWIMGGGENWLMPSGYDEFSLMHSPDVDKMVRGGVVKTLRAIGMDREVIEEGLEKNPGWRSICISKGFSNEFEPIKFSARSAGPADDSHRKNWIAVKEYLYYQEHKNSVDKYGKPTQSMQMTQEEYVKLSKVLGAQNAERIAFLEKNGRNVRYNPRKSTSIENNNDEDTLSK